MSVSKPTLHVTRRAITRRAGVSLATVSRALAPAATGGVARATQQRIAVAMQELRAPQAPSPMLSGNVVRIIHESDVHPFADPLWSGVMADYNDPDCQGLRSF